MEKDAISISKEMLDEAQQAFDDASNELERAKKFHERVKEKLATRQEIQGQKAQEVVAPIKPRPAGIGTLADNIYRILQEQNGRQLKQKAIIEMVKEIGFSGDPGTVSRALGKLRKLGKIETPKRAFYRVKKAAIETVK